MQKKLVCTLIPILLLCLFVPAARADDQTRQLAERLAVEAAAFSRLSTQVLAVETLSQRAQKPPRRFRIRLRRADREQVPEWQDRQIVSEYGFTNFTADGALHELRQVQTVDGKPVKDALTAEDLARLVMATDDNRKQELLEQFEDYGLLGAVNDFGQLILLFTPEGIQQYEFTYLRTEMQGVLPVNIFRYQQIDGPEALTFIDGRRDRVEQIPIQGEIWARENFLPVKITLSVVRGEGAEQMREEVAVDYTLSGWGGLLPAETNHREFQNGELIAENHFSYTEYRRFAASSEIVFTVDETMNQATEDQATENQATENQTTEPENAPLPDPQN